MNTLNKTFLPVTLDECHARGWDAPDFVYVCGDAYVDHPSFGLAIISRILEKAGYRVAMLCLPPWQDASAFKQFGKPRLGFLVSAGVIDSMVNHYTVAKKRRHDDAYAPGGQRIQHGLEDAGQREIEGALQLEHAPAALAAYVLGNMLLSADEREFVVGPARVAHAAGGPPGGQGGAGRQLRDGVAPRQQRECQRWGRHPARPFHQNSTLTASTTTIV